MQKETLQPEDTYGAEFYQAQVEGSLRSAQVVVPQILSLLPSTESVIDIGCGTGAWLSVFLTHGVETVYGIDGGSVPPEHFLIDPNDFLSHLLTTPVELSKKYDLVTSLEVAEHLEEENAEGFIQFLCDASDVAVFGAAIPGQGGHNHVNERWPSYWQALFQKKGYKLFDIIRPLIWTDSRVEWWYRQNTFVYVNESRKDLISHFEEVEKGNLNIIDVVHPDCYLGYRKSLDRYINPAAYQYDELREWSILRINEEHRLLCEKWLEQLLEEDISTIALFCAGAMSGLGPYIIARCGELDINICAYVDHFSDRWLDDEISIPAYQIENIKEFSNTPEVFLIASPGYADEFIHSIKSLLGEIHPPLKGSVGSF